MNVKYNKLLFVAGIIDLLLGLFYLVCGILEFTNALHTTANTVTQTIGVQLSYLVFISSIFITTTGLITVVYHSSLRLINTRMFMGVASLAWPLFLQITLFFTQLQINIRLLTMTLASLFYIISVLIVKITNDDFSKGVKFNPSAIIAQSGKRAKTIDLNNAVNKSTMKVERKNFAHTVENIASSVSTHRTPIAGVKRLFSGKRRFGGGNIFKGLYSGKKRRGSNIIASLLQNKKRSSHFRFRR